MREKGGGGGGCVCVCVCACVRACVSACVRRAYERVCVCPGVYCLDELTYKYVLLYYTRSKDKCLYLRYSRIKLVCFVS